MDKKTSCSAEIRAESTDCANSSGIYNVSVISVTYNTGGISNKLSLQFYHINVN